MAHYSININEENKCAECGNGGATDSGLCLQCCAKVLSSRPLKSDTAKAARKRLQGKTFGQRPFEIAVAVTGGKQESR